jgi:hypothetical protein
MTSHTSHNIKYMQHPTAQTLIFNKLAPHVNQVSHITKLLI